MNLTHLDTDLPEIAINFEMSKGKDLLTMVLTIGFQIEENSLSKIIDLYSEYEPFLTLLVCKGLKDKGVKLYKTLRFYILKNLYDTEAYG